MSRLLGRVGRRQKPMAEPARSRSIVAWLTRGRLGAN
jgi:hypothetical protein